MKHPRAVLLVLCLSFSFTACVKVLSKRSDEQAWLEFDQEIRQSRSPASRFPKSSTSEFLREALTAVPVRTLLLKCGHLASPESCYRAAITQQFDEIFRKVQSAHPELKNADYRKEQAEFLQARSFLSVSQEVNRFHQSILSGMDLLARERSADLFTHCENEASRDMPIENFSVFSGAVFEMPKAVYACLSRAWSADQDQLIEDTAERVGLTIVTSEAKAWIKREQVVQVYEQEMNELIRKKSKEEQEHFAAEKGELLKEFNPKLPQETLLKEWSKTLRARFPYSPVEQWVSTYRKEQLERK